jgi:uncharacterized protein (DUF305 family)
MKAPPRQDVSAPGRTDDGGHDVDGDPDTVSDQAAERLFKLVLIVLGLVLVVVAVAGVAAWLTSSNDEQEPLGEVDIGFMQDMLDHHDQALVISEAYAEGSPDGDAAPYASEVVMFQTRDIARMEQWLADDGAVRGAPDREAMLWMPMADPTPVGEMPGMQDQARIAELEAARGSEADVLFFELMAAHHLGGVLMANYAAENAESELIRDFAAAVSYNQRIEVVEYEGAVERLGLG